MGALAMVITPSAWAKYPQDKNIRVIIHVPAGGSTDVMSRIITSFMAPKLGTKFFIEEHAGAGGQIGYTELSKAKPDGYNIGAITTMSCISHEFTRKNLPYTLRGSFIPICQWFDDSSGLYVLADSPIKTLDDLIQTAKKKGGKMTCAGSIIWGVHHLHMLLLSEAAGFKMTFMPSDGSSDTRAALLGGHVDAAFGGVSDYGYLIKQGKLRGLAIARDSRFKDFPDWPTYKELGYDIALGSLNGFAAPAGTPQEYVDLLDNAVKETFQDKGFRKASRTVNMALVLSYKSGKDFRDTLYKLQDSLRPVFKKYYKKK